jgi:hypothetical protein
VVLPEAVRPTRPVAPVGDPVPVLPGIEERRLGHVEADLPPGGLNAADEVAGLRPRERGCPAVGLHVEGIEVDVAHIREEGPDLIGDADRAPVEVVGARHQASSARVADVEAVLLVLLRPDRLAGDQEAEAAQARRRGLVVADVDAFDCHRFT